mmetsp:Transcript_64063/g.152783  ORF Transcript_64063/g.152783 Transcript_64063/m.152783 type:complete len:152 (+) Transcript_64063:69-524(+)
MAHPTTERMADVDGAESEDALLDLSDTKVTAHAVEARETDEDKSLSEPRGARWGRRSAKRASAAAIAELPLPMDEDNDAGSQCEGGGAQPSGSKGAASAWLDGGSGTAAANPPPEVALRAAAAAKPASDIPAPEAAALRNLPELEFDCTTQ